MIFGVALLALCMYIGSFFGSLLGLVTGLGSDVGGVGFAMLLFFIATNSKKITSVLPSEYDKGLRFWKEMFIPVTIAMSAIQNVTSALSGGLLALAAGVGTVIISFLLIPLFNRVLPERKNEEETEIMSCEQ